jgi:hypothetical protein
MLYALPKTPFIPAKAGIQIGISGWHRRAGSPLSRGRTGVTALLLLGLLAPAVSHAQSDRSYTIMAPEPGRPQELTTPWLPPTYKSPRGSHNRVTPVEPLPPPHRGRPVTPPPLVVPQTGQVVPNRPVLSPSGPNGTETFQDKASRCVSQSSAPGAGNPNAYVGTCVNQ